MTGPTRHTVVPAYLAACLLLGGASAAGIVGNLVLQLCALPIIGWSLLDMSWERLPAPARSLLLLVLTMVAVLLLQLIPLPPTLWTMLPGRQPVVDGFALMRVPLPWLPLSLTPGATVASMTWMLPAVATLLGMTVPGAFRSSWLGWMLLVVTALGVGLGTLQVVGGSDGGAYLYHFSNWGQAVGFFANSNHMATLLVICIPFLFALRQSGFERARSRQRASALQVLVWACLAVLLVGLVTNMSLAGLGIGVPVALLSLLGFRSKPVARQRLLLGAIALMSLAGVGAILAGPVQNNLFGSQTAYRELSRQTSFARTLDAAGEYLPFGSGVGSFQPVYRTQEPLQDVTTTYMNHAHSDWLELLLETGLVGVALAAAFLLWWSRRAAAIWRSPTPDHYAKAATIASGAMLLHSVVDYPLRTAALSAVFAMCLALMSDVRPFAMRTRASAKAREVTF